jgi:uncharacterized protein
MPNFLIPLYRFFRSNRLVFYLFLLALIMGILFFASRLNFEEDISGTVRNPNDKTGFDEVIGNFRFSDKLILTLGMSGNQDTSDPEILARYGEIFLDSLSSKFDSTYVSSVNGKVADTLVSFYISYLYNHLPFYLDDQDYQRIDRLINPDTISEKIRKDYSTLVSPAGFALKEMILRDPLEISYIAMNKMRSLQAGGNYTINREFIFTRDLRNLLIFITPANPSSETSVNSKLIYGIDVILKNIHLRSGSKVKGYCFGSVAVAVGNAQQLKQDIFLSVTIALVLIVLLIGFYFRSIRIPLLGFLPALFGGGFALAMLYIIRGHISVIALGVGSVILGLIVDYALYYINRFTKSRNTEEVLKEMSLTIFLCFLTSAGAFLCLLFLRSSVLNDLGLFAAMSVAGAAFFALVILPQFLGISKNNQPKKTGILFIERFSAIPFEKKWWLISALLLFGIISLFFFRKVDFEKDMMSMNFMSPELKQAEEAVNRITEVSLKNVYVVSTGRNMEECLRMDEKVHERMKDLQEKGIVRSFNGPGDAFISDSLQRIKIRKWNEFWTPEKKQRLIGMIHEAAAKYKFRPDAFIAFSALLDTQFSPLGEQASAYAKNLFGRDWISQSGSIFMAWYIAKVKQEDKEAIYKYFNGLSGIYTFDKQLLTNLFVVNVKHDFELLVNLSMIFVTLILFIAFGRIELTLITAFPMYFSWLVTLGFMGIAGIRFNIFNIIISSFIFGLGVDYSIIMMRMLQHKYKYGFSEIVNYKVSIFLSSATTIFGVAALFFARHPALNSVALISVVGITTVVLSSYIFQPLFTEWFLFAQLDKKSFPVTAWNFIRTLITWGSIALIGILMMITGLVLKNIVPMQRKRKEYWFHYIFSKLCGEYIAVSFPTKRKLLNPYGEDFSKPAIIISNHQSLIETPAFLRLHPKMIILTNNWVWNSPLFGPVARFASFYNVEHGIDSLLEPLREKVKEGYSILVFPEGHRSYDHRIQRFHRGAFYMAEKLKMDVLPVIVFGSGDFLPRGAFWGRPNALYMKIMERVSPDDDRLGSTYSERTKMFRRYYIDLYREFKMEFATCDYYSRLLVANYIFKGPVLEWYLKAKLRISSNYALFHKLLPSGGKILDVGCGYGFISYMLALTGESRHITGIDYDPEKILVAQNGFLRNERIEFICEDITKFRIEAHDAFLISDVLHYLTEQEQDEFLETCMRNLNPGGVILIRDADAEREKKHRGTRITEFFSTKILGFNKTGAEKRLFFTSIGRIRLLAEKNRMKFEIIEEARHTSNLLVSIRK